MKKQSFMNLKNWYDGIWRIYCLKIDDFMFLPVYNTAAHFPIWILRTRKKNICIVIKLDAPSNRISNVEINFLE